MHESYLVGSILRAIWKNHHQVPVSSRSTPNTGSKPFTLRTSQDVKDLNSSLPAQEVLAELLDHSSIGTGTLSHGNNT